MPKLYIPEIGDELILSKDWNFTLHLEHRNKGLVSLLSLANTQNSRGDYLGLTWLWTPSGLYAHLFDPDLKLPWSSYAHLIEPWWDQNKHIFEPIITLPTGSKLKVDRIYIRKGAKEFSSITFYLSNCAHPSLDIKKKYRFWAKLADVNTLEIQ